MRARKRHYSAAILLAAFVVPGCCVMRTSMQLVEPADGDPGVTAWVREDASDFWGFMAPTMLLMPFMKPIMEQMPAVDALSDDKEIVAGPLGWFLATFTPFFSLWGDYPYSLNMMEPWHNYRNEHTWEDYLRQLESWSKRSDVELRPENWREIVASRGGQAIAGRTAPRTAEERAEDRAERAEERLQRARDRAESEARWDRTLAQVREQTNTWSDEQRRRTQETGEMIRRAREENERQQREANERRAAQDQVRRDQAREREQQERRLEVARREQAEQERRASEDRRRAQEEDARRARDAELAERRRAAEERERAEREAKEESAKRSREKQAEDRGIYYVDTVQDGSRFSIGSLHFRVTCKNLGDTYEWWVYVTNQYGEPAHISLGHSSTEMEPRTTDRLTPIPPGETRSTWFTTPATQARLSADCIRISKRDDGPWTYIVQ